MCLRDPFRIRPQGGSKRRVMHLPKTIYKRNKPALPAEGLLLLPLSPEGKRFLVNDLLCEEALFFPRNHNQTKMATIRHRGECLHHELPPKVVDSFDTSPASQNYQGSSFQSKIRDPYSNRLLHHYHKFCEDSPRKAASQVVLSIAHGISSEAKAVELEEAMEVLLAREAKTQYRLTDCYVDLLMIGEYMAAANSCLVNLAGARRRCVHLIFKLVEALRLSTMIAAHAVAYLDRFLCQRATAMECETSETQFQLAATACLRIAAKMDNTATPSLSSLCGECLIEGPMNEKKLGHMEAVVLQVLGWHMLAVTASDFMAIMLAYLSYCGLPAPDLQSAGDRADELIQGTLTEVEFLDYEPSVVSICVMQCLLDENLPLQAAPHMAAIRTFLAIDTLAAEQCYKTLVDLVVMPLIPSPAQSIHGSA